MKSASDVSDTAKPIVSPRKAWIGGLILANLCTPDPALVMLINAFGILTESFLLSNNLNVFLETLFT